MRVIIAGSRSMTAAEEVATAIAHSGFAITEVISGGARGVDTLGEAWARTHKIPTRRFPAQWERYGKSAGFRRNEAMAHVADALIAVWDGSSPGTCHMIATARQRGLRIFVWQPPQAPDHHRRRREGCGLPARFSLLSVAGPPPAVGVFLPRGPSSSHYLTLNVEVLGAADQLTQTGRTYADTVR